MVWEQLSINKPHLVYIILGGFTTIFMLVSLFIKEKLYIGEATVATICGLIFGPHGADLIDPSTWGNTDQITLEFSRIVLVVQCFAVGVELPKAYMERHWVSVLMLLVPVMTFGWLVTSLFVWWMIEPLTWLESLCVAACVTATDPVLASSVVGKGKFAKRVPKHIRDLLSAESGCNDGMAFPFIYLALNLIHYHLDAKHVTQHWFVNTILYECIWGAVYGVLVGYIARQAIKWAERKGIIDRESFLVFYFVLALFCAGSGSLLGMDDLLVGFAAGVGFSNDGWFTEKTEESHVSNVIDLLLNLTYFVYLGTIIPWAQYNSGEHGLKAWRLVVIALMVVFFRRIPIMLALKPFVPDIKTWREALFCGHFGPIGVGAIFVAILARAELETDTTTPLATLPPPDSVQYVLIYTIWPITTFLVITSIVVHGSSIAVFTLGKRINTLTLTLTYTQGNDKSDKWMDRLPRIASRSKSQGRSFNSEYSDTEKAGFPSGELPPIGLPQLALRRQKDEDYEREKPIGRNTSHGRSKRRKNKNAWSGGPISDSAITPQRRSDPALISGGTGTETPNSEPDRPSPYRLTSDQVDKLKANDSDPDTARARQRTEQEISRGGRSTDSDPSEDVEIEVYEEGGHLVIEDEEGNVLETVETKDKSQAEKAVIIEQVRERLRKDTSGKYVKHKHESHQENEEEEAAEAAVDAVQQPEKGFRDHFKSWKGFGLGGGGGDDDEQKKPQRKRGPAHAYQIGNTIIVEDEDGEVIHKYEIPREDQEPNKYNDYMRTGMQRMGTWVGLARKQSQMPESSAAGNAEKLDDTEDASTTSPDNDGNNLEPVKSIPATSKDKRSAGDREPSALKDDGLRIAISHTDQYGLTGLRKTKPGERPGMEVGGGRKLSTVDFIKSMQQMDQQKRQQVMNDAGVSKEKQNEVQRVVQKASDRDAANRSKSSGRIATTPGFQPKSPANEMAESKDYFSLPNSSGRTRSKSDAKQPQQPAPKRTTTAELKEGEDEEDIPTHDVRSAITRHGKGNVTSADARRAKYRDQPNRIEEEADDGDSDDGDSEDETAAEKKRRLAALGLGGTGGRDSDSSDDDKSPRVIRRAVQEPGPDATATTPRREREKFAEPLGRRIQWGDNTTGVVRGKGRDEQEVEGSGNKGSSGTFGKKLKGFLDK